MTNLIPLQFDKSTGRLYAKNSAVSGSYQTIGYVFVASSAITTWTIHHNGGTQKLLVQIFDVDNKVVLPDEITVVDDNTVSVHFIAAQAGTATLVLFINPT